MNEPTGDRWKPSKLYNLEYNTMAHDFKGTGLAGGFMLNPEEEQSDLRYLVKIRNYTNNLAHRNPADMNTMRNSIRRNEKYNKIDEEFKELKYKTVKDFDQITGKVDKLIEKRE